MTDYLSIAYFVSGLVTGMLSIFAGFRLGFKVSYDIRAHKDDTTNSDGLFQPKKNPGEFDLLDGEPGEGETL